VTAEVDKAPHASLAVAAATVGRPSGGDLLGDVLGVATNSAEHGRGERQEEPQSHEVPAGLGPDDRAVVCRSTVLVDDRDPTPYQKRA
jgi:hypothetical protein